MKYIYSKNLRKILIGSSLVIFTVVGISYQNCGNIEHNQNDLNLGSENSDFNSQSLLTSKNRQPSDATSQSNVTEEESVEKFDAQGNSILLSGTYAKCTNWVQEAYLKASNADAADYFGESVSISGNTVVVAARNEASSQSTITNGPGASSDNSFGESGAAYVYRRINNLWQQEAYLKPSNINAQDRFGASVSISGSTIVVGSQYEESSQTTVTNGSSSSSDNSADAAGAAYVFRRVNNSWQQEAYLKASNAGYGDQFGSDVSISGDAIVVGAFYESSSQTTVTNGSGSSSDNSAESAGAAYVYRRVNGLWQQEAYLKASNAESGDHFATTVSISGDTVVVGSHQESSGQNYITNGPGSSSDNGTQWAGAAYVYRRVNGLWQQQAYLKPSIAGWQDAFGYKVSISGNAIVVTAIDEDSAQTTVTNGSGSSNDNSAPTAGAAYVFRRVNNLWTQEAYLKSSNIQSEDTFGSSISIAGDEIVIGAAHEDSSQSTITNGPGASADNSIDSSGAAYVFRRVNNLWTQEAYLKPSNPGVWDLFGKSVSISGNTIIVGSVREDSSQTTITHGVSIAPNDNALDAGAAYIYWCKSGVLPHTTILSTGK